MATSADDTQRIDAYLKALRARLRGMNAEAVREITDELRGHIAERVSTSGKTPTTIEAVLAALGSPEELASQYMTDELLARAEVSRSPFRILESLFRWATLSVAGFLVLLGSLAGYGLGVVLLLCALLKPFHPHTAGLWLIPDTPNDLAVSLRLGFGSAPTSGREVLGWWIVPLGLVVGCGLVTLTTRASLWCTRRYRRSLVLNV